MKNIKNSSKIWLYGKHAVFSALQNAQRICYQLHVTKPIFDEYTNFFKKYKTLIINISDTKTIASKLPDKAVHQNIALEVAPLAQLPIAEAIDLSNNSNQSLLMLDQITDPHNTGAIIRSSAAFGATAVITTFHNAPSETGTLAKSACGALETIPFIHINNLANEIKYLKKFGFWAIGLDSSAKTLLHEMDIPPKSIFIIGAEDTGLRRLTKENCDFIVKIPISPRIESLNASNAAAIALYEFNRQHNFTKNHNCR
jgi:23S rRNA (guanosine2251-2'-O)-methyltransferase